MKEKKARPRIARKQHRVNVPLCSLKTSDAVKILSASPRRLEELWELFEDRDRTIRQRGAAALAQLACLQPATLRRSGHRIRELLQDESAYVRWHALYAVGQLVAGDRARMKSWIPDLAGTLEDPNGIVRAMSAKMLTRAASRDPRIIDEAFQEIGRETPLTVSDALKERNKETRKKALKNSEEESA
jgi:hypothetical protein